LYASCRSPGIDRPGRDPPGGAWLRRARAIRLRRMRRASAMEQARARIIEFTGV